jgi:ubiquinone/menaquinone biosynthesis C-methylase UbiE
MTHWTEQLFKQQADSYTGFFDSRFEEAKPEARDTLALIEAERDSRPERVLDVACGTGRHVVAFAEEGCEATGLDFSAEFVEEARDNAHAAGVADSTTFHVQDMRELDEFGENGAFDLATLFWNSLGYYDKKADVAMLTELYRLLDDGALLMEVGNKECYVHNLEDSSVQEFEGGLHAERREFDVESARFHHTLDVFESDSAGGYDHSETMEWEYRSYAPAELVEMCERAGFETVSLFGSLDGEELTLDSMTTYVVATS